MPPVNTIEMASQIAHQETFDIMAAIGWYLHGAERRLADFLRKIISIVRST
jgi:hypothetical protein